MGVFQRFVWQIFVERAVEYGRHLDGENFFGQFVLGEHDLAKTSFAENLVWWLINEVVNQRIG